MQKSNCSKKYALYLGVLGSALYIITGVGICLGNLSFSGRTLPRSENQMLLGENIGSVAVSSSMDEVEVGLPEQSGSGNEVVPIEPGKEDAQKTQQSDSAKESSLQLKEGWYWFMEDHPAEEERVSETESSPDKEEEK